MNNVIIPNLIERKVLSDGLYPEVLDGCYASPSDCTYCAFPSIYDGGEEILVAFKHGGSHCNDISETRLIKMRRDGEVISDKPVFKVEGKNTQNVELLCFPDGSLRMFFDIQAPYQNSTVRCGAVEVIYKDPAAVPSEHPLCDLDGTVYGYVFDGVMYKDEYRLLAMSFPENNGGRPKEVAVLTMKPDGWEKTLSLNDILGESVNESSFAVLGGNLYIAVRCYTQGNSDNCRLIRIEGENPEKIAIRKLTLADDGINNIGRPKLSVWDDKLYLLMRNVPTAHPTEELVLCRIDYETLAIEQTSRLEGPVDGDGYYAEAYRDGDYLRVVTYKSYDSKTPDIILLTYLWNEVS